MASMFARGTPLGSGLGCAPSAAPRRPPAFAPPQRRNLACQAEQDTKSSEQKPVERGFGLGDLLGPIGLTVGGDVKKEDKSKAGAAQLAQRAADAVGVSLGPISLTYGDDLASSADGSDEAGGAPAPSLSTLTTEEWRARYEEDGAVDLWVEEEFNSGSRLVGGRRVHFGGEAGYLSGEGSGASAAPRHTVKIFNEFAGQELEVEVPEDRYILWEAEDQGLELPYACRMGCCTACTVRIKEGEMYQPQSLGLSQELKDQGYGLMCVGFPLTDLVLEVVPEGEAYELQFGRHFDQYGADVNSGQILRDDYAMELAMLDE